MSSRKTLWKFGARPHTVTVFTETTASGPYTRVRWHRNNTKSFPDTAVGRREAKAYGQQLADDLKTGPAREASITLASLWDHYVAAEFDALRAKTQINYADHWRSWETFAGCETKAETITRETLDTFRKELKRTGLGIGQIKKRIEQVKRVYRFGVDRELILPTKLTDYRVKVAKDEKLTPTAEYRSADATKIIAALDPNKSTQWRSWAFCVIAHYMGTRANAILHLQWADVEGGEITWRAKWDKVGRERPQPMPLPVVDALTVAKRWREHDGYKGAWVFYTARRNWKGDQPITYGGLNWMLRQAETRAGIEHVHMNAAHRFRRGVAGDVHEKTGDATLAMQWIGDQDLAQAKRYLKHRDDRLRGVAALLSGGESEAAD